MTKFRLLLTTTSAVALLVSFATPAAAQVASTPDVDSSNDPTPSTKADGSISDTVEAGEIVVTAQKRSERLRDVPISISVLEGAGLDKSSREGTLDALKQVPGVVVADGGNLFSPTVTIRGVASLAGSSPVAYYIDAVPFGFTRTTFSPDAGSFDLDRMEVLRGPQGTLYGASALNGVVRILTNNADTDTFEFKARAAVQTTEGGDFGYRGDAALNIPVVTDKLGLRAVVGYQDLGGWIDQPNRKNSNNNKLQTLRLKARATPTDKLTIDLSGWWSRQDFGGQNSSTSEQTRISLLRETASLDFNTYSAEIGYDLGGVQLSSRTSYIDFSNRNFLDFAPFYVALGLPLVDTLYDSRFSAKTFAQEVVLNSTAGGPWKWTVGAMYRNSEEASRQGLAGFSRDLSDVDFVDRSKSYAVFGEVTRELIPDRLELTGGLRYFKDRVSLQENRTYLSLPELVQTSRTFKKVTPRAVLTWHPNSDATIYASYAQGFRSGVLQDPSVIRVADVDLPNTRPDQLTNYEIGTKQKLLDGMLYVEAAIYYAQWKDVFQVLEFATSNNIFAAVLNGGDVNGFGAEIAVTFRPVQRLSLSGSFSWNDLEFDKAFFPFSSGDRVNGSPKYTASGSINYSFPLNGMNGYVGASADYRGKFVNQGTNDDLLISPYVGGEARFIARVEAGVEADSGWGAKAYIDNLTDSYAGGGKNWRAFDDWITRPRPRTFGFQIEYKY